MYQTGQNPRYALAGFSIFIALFIMLPPFSGFTAEKKPPANAVPVRVAVVEERVISEQTAIIGSTEPVRQSTVAAEISGRVEAFYVKAGDFVEKDAPLVSLESKGLALRVKGVIAAKEGIEAKLVLAEKELSRVAKLKGTNSVAAKQYDEAFFNHIAFTKDLERSEVEIEQLQYDITKKRVLTPFSGFIAEEHTQVGEWVNAGGRVVTLVDLSNIRIKVDVPEEHAVRLSPKEGLRVVIKSLSDRSMTAEIEAVLPQGDPVARTFPVHIRLANPQFRIKGGMEAVVTFDVGEKRKALLIPKDAVVSSGAQKIVYTVDQGKAFPVTVEVVGYYNNSAVVKDGLTPGRQVVIRGNERLRPGQEVEVIDR